MRCLLSASRWVGDSRPRPLAGIRGWRIVPLAACCLAALACARPSVAVLMTDRAELAAYVETFNATQSNHKVVLWYHERPAAALADNSAYADLVLASGLTDPRLLAQLAPLDRLFGEGQLERGSFYRGLLRAGQFESRQHALPFNFNLPAVVYRSGDLTPGLTISPSALYAAAAGFPADSQSRGFSPAWDPDFLYYTALVAGAGLRASGATVAVDMAAAQRAIDFSRHWIQEINGGLAADMVFKERNFHMPLYRLVLAGRIRFYLSTSDQFYLIPADQRVGLDFAWYAGASAQEVPVADGQAASDQMLVTLPGIPVADDATYFGIPGRSRGNRAALAFLRWILEPGTQTTLLEVSQFKRLRAFGLAGGFSALRTVTEREIPNVYPHVIGHLPAAEQLLPQQPLPPDWSQLRRSVIHGWLQDALASGAPTSLADRVTAWRRYTENVGG